MQKTLYWDINTKAKIKKVQKEVQNSTKKVVSESKVVRKAIYLTPFDKLVAELNKEISNV